MTSPRTTICMNVPVRMLDEEEICGIGNERQDPACLRFNLYQGANLPALSGASSRGRSEQRRTHHHPDHRQTSCQLWKPCCPAIQKFSLSLNPFQTQLRIVSIGKGAERHGML